jgi:hypothetical protein
MNCDLEQRIKDKEESIFAKKEGILEEEREVIALKTKLRKATLIPQFNKFIAKQSKDVQDSVYLNEALLHAAVGSYYYDIHRYKDFSGSKWANQNKQAAYTIKWIAKFRPIQIKEKTVNVTDSIFDINLIFALLSGFSFLDRDVVDLIMKDRVETDIHNGITEGKEHRKSLYDKLLYLIRYKPLSGKLLIATFDALGLVCKKPAGGTNT